MSSTWIRVLRFPVTRVVIAVVVVLTPTLLIQWPIAARHLERTWVFLPAAVLMATLVVIAYRAYVRWIERRAPVELGPPRIAAEVSAGVALGALLFGLTIGALRLLGCYEVLGRNPVSVLVYPLGGSIVSAVLEETLFRGILFRILEESLGSWIALAISAALFGSAHLVNSGATTLGVASIALEAGVLLAAAFLFTRRLWLAMGLHFAWNFTEAGVFGVEVSGSGRSIEGLLKSRLSGPDWLSGGAFGAEASVVAVGFCLVAGIGLILAARRRGHVVAPFWARRATPCT